MMTVLNPAGTPTIVYNRDGTTIESVTAAGTDQGSAASIPRSSGWTVVMVSIPDSSDQCVVLPSTAEIGDVFEIYRISGGGTELSVFPPSGGKISALSTDTAVTVVLGGIFRFVGSCQWGGMSA